MKILIVCGTGIVCSSIIRVKLEKLCDRLHVMPVIRQCAYRELDKNIDSDLDLIIMAMDLPVNHPIETVLGSGYLFDDDESADAAIFEAILKINS